MIAAQENELCLRTVSMYGKAEELAIQFTTQQTQDKVHVSKDLVITCKNYQIINIYEISMKELQILDKVSTLLVLTGRVGAHTRNQSLCFSIRAHRKRYIRNLSGVQSQVSHIDNHPGDFLAVLTVKSIHATL